jgi:hypothetical protein
MNRQHVARGNPKFTRPGIGALVEIEQDILLLDDQATKTVSHARRIGTVFGSGELSYLQWALGPDQPSFSRAKKRHRQQNDRVKRLDSDFDHNRRWVEF